MCGPVASEDTTEAGSITRDQIRVLETEQLGALLDDLTGEKCARYCPDTSSNYCYFDHGRVDNSGREFADRYGQ